MDNTPGGSGPQRRARAAQRQQQQRTDTNAPPAGGSKPPGNRPPPPTPVGSGPHGPDPKWLHTSRAHIQTLTGRHRQSVIDYTGDDHKRINGWLRRGQVPDDQWITARVKDLDAVLAKNPLTQPATLTRTIDLSSFGLTTGDDLTKVVGSLRTERGYMSTTRHPSGGATKDYANPVRLTVHAPAGTPAAAIEDISKVPGQGEVLLGRDLRYLITSQHFDAEIGIWRATIEITER